MALIMVLSSEVIFSWGKVPGSNSVRRVSDVLVACSVGWQQQVLPYGLSR